MSIILWIVLGGIAGWLASMIMKSGHGILGDIVIGILGALLGGFIMNMLGYGNVSGFNLYSLLVAVLGSVVLLWIVKAVRGRGVHV
ncbi:MAG: GlsB/YeaQ/YmgE family stress response membrane protein [Candidatus Doudnabacteria bacterium]